jgi:hypothetical protein
MGHTLRESGSAGSRVRFVVALLSLGGLCLGVAACGEETGPGTVRAEDGDLTADAQDTVDVPLSDGDLADEVAPLEVTPEVSGEVMPPDISDGTEVSDAEVVGEVIDGFDLSEIDGNTDGDTGADGSGDGSPLDSAGPDGVIDGAPDTAEEPCEPDEPCSLEVAWDCVEGICTSLGTCAPTPISGCCTKDADCSSLEPPDACSFFTCVETVCTANPIPGCCTSVSDCSDGEACTLDQCPIPGALCIHCPAGCGCPEDPPAFTTGFDEGFFPLGWIVSDANLGDAVGWHVSGRRWLRPPYAAYLGDADCGTYSNTPLDAACDPLPLPGPGGTKITATLKTPSVPLLSSPAGYVALFWLWSEVDALTTGGAGETDVLSLEVEDALTQESWPLTSSLAVGKNTDGLWSLLGADLSPWAGKNVRLRFHFDTLQNLDNLHEGVYIDDVQVVPRCVGGCCADDADCADLPLADGCSEARCVDLAGGAGTVCAAVPTTPGELCEPCSLDVQCADENPCTTDTCGTGGVCAHDVFCCFEESVFLTSFEQELGGFSVGDSNPTDGVAWKLTGENSVLGFQSAWIADEATGTYASPGPIDVSLTTPSFFMPALSEVGGGLGLAFWLNLSTEWDGQTYANPAGIDRMAIYVVQGPVSTEVWTSDEVDGSTEGSWVPVEVPMEDWAEAPVQIRFVFRSVDEVANDHIGPMIDAIKVGRVCPLE